MLIFLTLFFLGFASFGTITVRTPFSTCALIWSNFTFSGNSISREKSPFPVPLSATCQTLSFAIPSSLPPSPVICNTFPSSTCTFMFSLLNPIYKKRKKKKYHKIKLNSETTPLNFEEVQLSFWNWERAPGTLILKMWAFGDSSQSIRAVDPDHSRKTGGLRKKRLKGYPKILSAIVLIFLELSWWRAVDSRIRFLIYIKCVVVGGIVECPESSIPLIPLVCLFISIHLQDSGEDELRGSRVVGGPIGYERGPSGRSWGVILDAPSTILITPYFYLIGCNW